MHEEKQQLVTVRLHVPTEVDSDTSISNNQYIYLNLWVVTCMFLDGDVLHHRAVSYHTSLQRRHQRTDMRPNGLGVKESKNL